MDLVLLIGKFVLFIAFFGVGSYFVAKKIKKGKTNIVSTNGSMRVIDITNIGMNEKVILLQVGEESVLYFSSSNGVHGLRLEQTHTTTPKEEFDEMFQQEAPSMALSKIKDSIGERLKWKK